MRGPLATCLTMAILAATSVMAAAPERTYYTEARMKTLKRNLEDHAWARKERAKIIQRADKWLQYDDERLRTLVPPPEVPRAVVAHVSGAPVNGAALNKIGRYSWRISFDKPWKVTSPVDGKVYPSNDFAAFMKSGYKDRTLLTGPYPDDGWGCKVKGFDKPFWFAGVYAHWCARNLLLPALDDLSRAHLITDDPRYAHACALLLWQLAEYYPNYFYEKQSRYAKEVQPNYNGRLLYHTWESLFTCHTVPPAYDAVRPYINKDTALMKLTGQTGEEIQAHIEDRILRTMANDIMDGSGRIQGNYGMHQVSLLRIAAVLRDSKKKPTGKEMAAWVLHNPRAANYTQLGMEDAVNNLLHRDGYPFESPSYNCHWITALGEMAEALGEEGKKIIAMPRFRKLYAWPMRMSVVGKFTPSYGDSNHLFHGALGWSNRYLETGYRFYQDPVIAKAMIQSGANFKRDLFSESIDDKVTAAAMKYPGPLAVKSDLLPGVGFAGLQCGSAANRTGLAIFYGFYQGHRHRDRLQLDIYSHQNALTPDFGYPETADSYDPRRFGFLSHTVAHNTVMVNARVQKWDSNARGRLHVFDPGQFAQLVEVSAEGCYPKAVKLYRRTLMLVETAPDKAYIVDIFRVRGGAQHDWLVHGTQAAFKSDLPLSEPRKQGTLAGPDVPYGHFYDDQRYDDDNKAHVPYYLYEGSAFQWLFNVQQAQLNGVGNAGWHLNRPAELFPKLPRKDVVLRAHLVGRNETVFACDGIPQRRKTWPETIKFLVRRRTGKDLESVFVTVFEPYKKTPFIDSVKVLPVAANDDLPVALEITSEGKKHILFNRLEKQKDKPSVLTLGGGITIDARAAVLEQAADGAFTKTYLLNNTGSSGLSVPPSARPAASAKVKSIDYKKGEVTLTQPIVPQAPPSGSVAIVTSRRHANAVPVAAAISNTTFSVGDDDLYAGKVHVTLAQAGQITFHPKHVYFLEPGMTVINEAGKAVGRIKSVGSGNLQLTSRQSSLNDFPDLDKDGRRTCRIMVIGPGDDIVLHASARELSQ